MLFLFPRQRRGAGLCVLLSLVALCLSLPAVAQTSQADELFSQGYALYEQDDYASSLPLYLQAEAAFSKEGRTETPEYAKLLHCIGWAYYCTGDAVNGMAFMRRAIDLRECLLGKVSVDYINSLNNYATMLQDYEEAARIQKEVIDLCAQLPSPHPSYGLFAMNLGRYYFILDKYAEAAECFEIALPLTDKSSELYEKMLNWVGLCYTETGDQEGLSRTMALVEEHNQRELEKPCDEPTCMKERAEYYAVKGETAKAKECYMTVLSMKMTDEEKVDVYTSYANFLSDNYDYASAAEYYHLAASASILLSGKGKDYADQIFMAALYYYLGKEYDKAIKDYREVISLSSTVAEVDAKRLAQCHKGTGNALSAQHNYAEAAAEYQLEVDYYSANEPQDNEYPKSLVQLATAEKSNKDYELAVQHYKQAMAIYEERGMNVEYNNTQNSLNLCYTYMGQPAEFNEEAAAAAHEANNEKLDAIIKDELDNLELNRTYLGEYSYANSLATIAGSYYQKGDYANATVRFRQYIDALRDAVRDEFRMQSEKERMLLWGEQTDNIDEIRDMLVYLPEGYDTEFADLAAIAYDASLLSKGILLNSSIEFEKVLNESGDKNLQDIYLKIRANEEQLSSLRKNASTDADREKILVLARENQSLQLELYKGCAEYADFTDYISYRWQNVQAALGSDDVAVEFASIRTSPLDDDNYMVALVLTKESAPVAMPICNLSVAKFMETYDSLFVKSEPGALVWGTLAPYLEGKRRLYFSADGVFNNIGIEYLLYGDKPFSEQMEVYRLSSTKELCRKHAKSTYSNVALFGGIDYDGLDGLSQEKQDELAMIFDSERVAVSRSLGKLENSLREVQDIEGICKEKSVPNVLLFSGTQASETAFRQLDYSKLNLLHIATHGIYKADAKSTDLESMANSILAFAGYNFADDFTTFNDGKVSAADVAQMNLRQCDLAVLSACETGLGKLGEDGVFGLQRGFKNAGVQSLLMTLKPVSDIATTEMMITFYRYLMDGHSKRESLSLAQQDLRAKGYTDGRYWAVFILLDAVD